MSENRNDGQNEEKKNLIDLWPRDYGLRGEEAVIGQMLLAYLSSVEKEQAERIMEEVVKPNENTGTRQSSIAIDHKQLASVIDRSTEMAHSYLVERLRQDMEPDVLTEFEKIGVYLQKISGTTASQNCSPKLSDFLYDCLLVTRQ